MPDAATWPSALPHPLTQDWQPVGGAGQGGTSPGGVESRGPGVAGPYWRLRIDGLTARGTEAILAARGFQLALEGGSAPVIVPSCEGALSPQIAGGATLAAEFADAALLGATAVSFTLTGDHHDLRGGEQFSITHADAAVGQRLHRVEEITGGTSSAPEVIITPPLRADVEPGEACDFATPSCVMQLESGFTVAVEFGRIARINATFREWFADAASNLVALSLSPATIVEASAEDTVVGGLFGRRTGSTLTLVDDAGGRFKLTGTVIEAGATATDFDAATSHAITVRETLASAPNSPRDTVLTISVTEIGAAAFNPIDLDPEAWYWADEVAGDDDEVITVWPDRTGHGWHGAYGGDPRINYAEIGGRKAMYFSGDGAARFALSADLLDGATEGCYFAVIKRVTDPSDVAHRSGPILGFFTGITDAVLRQTLFPWTDGKIYENFGGDSRLDVDPGPALTSARIYSAHAGGGDLTVFLDGAEIASTPTNEGFAHTPRYIGWSQGSVPFLSTRFTGWMAEIIIFAQALSDADREKVEGYLAHLYGLTGNLDAGHPYKVTPP